tara:strand:- start:3431 stop:3769 length:339 start_codon:yes stop_codon:yes gene_type:complete
LISKKRILGISLLITGSIIATLPFVYYGYLEYVIGNSVIMLNFDDANISLRQAAIQLFNGHPISKMPLKYLLSVSSIGIFIAYLGVFISSSRKHSIRSIFTKDYWKTFKLLP